jgi:predicted DNA-binding protein
MTILNVKLDDDTATRLDLLAKGSQRTKSSYIKEMLELYLEDFEDGISALGRINDNNAEFVSLEDAKKELGL